MKDGLYKILHRNGGHGSQEVGRFEIIDGNIKNRDGLAKHVLNDGPVTGRVEFDILRLNNGYNWVEWERPVRTEPIHSIDPEPYLGPNSRAKPIKRGPIRSL